jgi:hypothetical protein
MERRKSLARRNPEVLYMIRPSRPGEPGVLYFRAWFADFAGHVDHDHPLGEGYLDELYGIEGTWWFTSKDTDSLNELPADVLAAVVAYDDEIRKDLRRMEHDAAFAQLMFQEPAHAHVYRSDLAY